MASNKKIAGVSLGAILLAIGAGSFAFSFDFSTTTTNIDSHDQSIFTNIINQFGLDITPEELETLCGDADSLEEPLRTACNVINRNTGS